MFPVERTVFYATKESGIVAISLDKMQLNQVYIVDLNTLLKGVKREVGRLIHRQILTDQFSPRFLARANIRITFEVCK
jgi:hypothetical protein